MRGRRAAPSRPSSWPTEALQGPGRGRAHLRDHHLAGGAGFDQYADTRSQVYGGVGGRDAAHRRRPCAATAGQVVTYEGQPVITYFFSTSGGRTENVENSFVGAGPKPWLKRVDDPYDDVSPQHRWGRHAARARRPARKLGGS